MRILFFSSYFYPYTSGVTTYPLKILSNLAKSNKVTALTFIHGKNLPDKEKIKGVEIVRMPSIFKISKGFISPQSLSFFFGFAKKSDLIILNVPNFEGLPLAIIGKLLGKKIITIFHCEVNLGSDLKSRIINFFLNSSVYLQLLFSNIIVAYTEDYIDHLSIGKIFRNKIKVVLPPVENLSISGKKINELRKLKGKKIWIGYAGRISQEKGLEHLVMAIQNSESRIQNLELVFAGPYGKTVAGENNYYLRIKNLLEQKKIRYHFFGNLSSGNLGAFYKMIDLLTLPSTNKTEAFGMVQAEAMLLGTPVIASNLPGVRVPIQLTKMGEIVEPKNVNQLSQAIEKVLKNKSKYSNEDLVKKAQKIFNIQKTYKFYDELLPKKIS